jgi:hypothetical protein
MDQTTRNTIEDAQDSDIAEKCVLKMAAYLPRNIDYHIPHYTVSSETLLNRYQYCERKL